jgi:hypothetical protein
MNEKRSFFAELKRRNVYKVAVAYVVVAWLLIQAASILFPTFEASHWMTTPPMPRAIQGWFSSPPHPSFSLTGTTCVLRRCAESSASSYPPPPNHE